MPSYNKAALKGMGSYNKAALKGFGSYNKAALKGFGSYNKAALKGMGGKKLIKGSPEAKAYMARLRAMRGQNSGKKKLKGGFSIASILSMVDPEKLAKVGLTLGDMLGNVLKKRKNDSYAIEGQVLPVAKPEPPPKPKLPPRPNKPLPKPGPKPGPRPLPPTPKPRPLPPAPRPPPKPLPPSPDDVMEDDEPPPLPPRPAKPLPPTPPPRPNKPLPRPKTRTPVTSTTRGLTGRGRGRGRTAGSRESERVKKEKQEALDYLKNFTQDVYDKRHETDDDYEWVDDVKETPKPMDEEEDWNLNDLFEGGAWDYFHDPTIKMPKNGVRTGVYAGKIPELDMERWRQAAKVRKEPELRKLYDELKKVTSPPERQKILKKITKLLIERQKSAVGGIIGDRLYRPGGMGGNPLEKPWRKRESLPGWGGSFPIAIGGPGGVRQSDGSGVPGAGACGSKFEEAVKRYMATRK